MNRQTLIIAAFLGLAAFLGTARAAEANDLEFAVWSGDAYVRYVHGDRHEYRRRHHRHHDWRIRAHDRWHWHNDRRRDRFYHRDHRRLHWELGLSYCSFSRREIWYR